VKLGDVLEKLALASQIQAHLKELRDLAPGESAQVPVIRFKANGKRYAWGPAQVKRE